MKMRTHTCGQLRPSDAGAKVELCGWVDSVRDHGGLIFLDLRDRYGVTQCVFDPQDSQAAWDAAQACRGEFVVKIAGEVRPRPADMVNERIATGGIEVRGTSIAVLNMEDSGDTAAAAAMATLILLAAATVKLLQLFLSRALLDRTQRWRHQ